MKKGLLIGTLSFVAGAYVVALGLTLIEKDEDNKVLFEDEKIKITQLLAHKNGDPRWAYIQMKDEKKA